MYHKRSTTTTTVYIVLLVFTITLSCVVFVLHLIDTERLRVFYIYLTNWTFVLFISGLIFSTIGLVYRKTRHTKLWKKLDHRIVTISWMSRTIYLYICTIYVLGLITNSPAILREDTKGFVGHLNDICKHFVFVILMVILFVLQPRTSDPIELPKFWHFLYPTGFLSVYTVFFFVYYYISGSLVYELSCATLTLLISSMPIGCCLIHQLFKHIDLVIRHKLEVVVVEEEEAEV